MKRSFEQNFNTLTLAYDGRESALKIRVKGDLKSTTIAALHRDLDAAMATENVKLADIEVLDLDLSDAEVVDSQGLNLVVKLKSAMDLRRAKVRLHVIRRTVYLTLLSVGLDRQMDILFDDGRPPRQVP